MSNADVSNNDRKMTSVFERFLSLWVVLCIVVGILIGKIATNDVGITSTRATSTVLVDI